MKTKKLILNFNSTNRMKKPITLRTLLASAVLCMSIAFVACQKNEVSNPSNVAKNEVKNPRSNAREQMYPFYLMEEPVICCIPIEGNCTNVVYVYGAANIQIMQNIFSVVKIGNTTNIVNSFQENRDFLANYLETQDVDGVISQELNVTHRYNSSIDTHFLIFKRENTTEIAYQLKFVNE